MNTNELLSIMNYLRDRVQLKPNEIIITFNTPAEKEMIDAGLNAEGVERILGVGWWDEMIEDIIETPDICNPEDSPQQVLEYAKDVVSEYIRKRFPLNEE
jgi:hypothetical protein